MLITHVLWLDIPAGVSLALILLCAAVIVLSGTLYGVRNLREIRRSRQEAPEQEEQQPPAA